MTLFAVVTERSRDEADELVRHPIMRRWWRHMAELMVTEEDGRPRTWALSEAFHLA